MKIFYLILLALFFVSCAHIVNMRGFDYGSLPISPMKNKKVAIVDDPSRIQNDRDTHTDVYTYKFRDISTGVMEALQKRVAMTAKQVDIVKPEEVAVKKGYDILLYPELSVRSVHDFWTMGCLVKYHLEVHGKEGQVLSNESGQGKRNFFSATQAEMKCKEAMSEVFISVTDKALNQIR